MMESGPSTAAVLRHWNFVRAYSILERELEVSWEAVSMADEKALDAAGTSTAPQAAGGTVRMVNCVKLGRELPGLDRIPWKGEIGKRVYDNVSKEAWKLWVEHSKMLMNEFRLNPLDPNSLKIMGDQMEQFFFGIGAQLPDNFVPPPEH
jgi:Fe-S cluster biosynthesis and repair protein YggX